MSKCYFHKYKIEPNFKDIQTLEKFLTARGKIMSSEKSGVCAKHQRSLSKHIKYARYLSLFPYTAYQSEKIKRTQNKSE